MSTNFIVKGEGPPVVLIHGLAASLHDWDCLAPELAEAGYQAFALDLLGHGDTIKPTKASDYHIKVVYRHLEDWIGRIHLSSPPILVGHSLGGYLALQYSLDHSKKVRGMVLVDPLYSPYQLNPLVHLLRHRPGFGAKALHMTPHWLIYASTRLDKINGDLFTEPVRRQIARDYKRASPHILRIPNSLEDLTTCLDQINQPTLVVWGERDLTLNAPSFSHLVSALPNSRGHVFPQSGHQPHLGKSREFNRLVIEFLDTLF